MPQELEVKPYLGTYARPLDEKRRLTVPSKWRTKGDDSENAYIALPNPNGCITVFPPKEVEIMYESARKSGDAEKKKAISKFFRRGDTVGCDRQGRLALPESLLAHAGIDREVFLFGDYNKFEVWNPAKAKARDAQDNTASDVDAWDSIF